MYGRTNASGKKITLSNTLTVSMHTTNKEYKVYELVKDQDGNTLIEETKYTGETAYNNGYSAGDSAGYTRGYNAGDSAGYTRGYNSRNSEVQNLNDYISWLESQNSTLVSNYNTLQTNYNTLQTNYNTLQSNYNSMKNNRDYWYNVAYGWYLTADQYSSIAWLNTYQGESWAVPGQGSWPDGYGPYHGYYGY